MTASILQEADDGLSQALQALTDAVASGDLTLAIVAGLLAAVVLALRLFGKKLPFVGAVTTLILGVVKKLAGKRPVAQLPDAKTLTPFERAAKDAANSDKDKA